MEEIKRDIVCSFQDAGSLSHFGLIGDLFGVKTEKIEIDTQKEEVIFKSARGFSGNIQIMVDNLGGWIVAGKEVRA